MTETPLDADGLPVPDPDFEAKRKAAFMAYLTASAETDVDEPVLYATDPGWFRDLSAKIPGLLVHSAGGACPFQSEGTLHGYPYYFRYRHGYAELTLSDPTVDEMSFERLYSAGMEHGEPLDGFLDREQFYDLMLALVPQLTRAPFLWEFQGVQVNIEDVANPAPANWEATLGNGRGASTNEKPREKAPMDLRFTATDTPETYRTWGVTPEQAHARLHETSAYLVQHGWSEEKQREHMRLQAINPNPVNVDTRAFPDPEPVFEVRP